jgi:hypothetical protein
MSHTTDEPSEELIARLDSKLADLARLALLESPADRLQNHTVRLTRSPQLNRDSRAGGEGDRFPV